MMLKKSIVLLASGLLISTAGCDHMFTASKPAASIDETENDARDCGASHSFLAGGMTVDDLEIPEFSECMRSRGYSFSLP